MPRAPKITLTAEQEAYLRAEHAKGTTYHVIAEAMGLSRASFARRVLALGLQRTSAERFRQQRARAIEKRPRRRPPRPARRLAIVRPPRPRARIPAASRCSNSPRTSAGGRAATGRPTSSAAGRSPRRGSHGASTTSSAFTVSLGGY